MHTVHTPTRHLAQFFQILSAKAQASHTTIVYSSQRVALGASSHRAAGGYVHRAASRGDILVTARAKLSPNRCALHPAGVAATAAPAAAAAAAAAAAGMSGWRKAKKLTAAASATRALTEMLPNLDDSQKHWVALARRPKSNVKGKLCPVRPMLIPRPQQPPTQHEHVVYMCVICPTAP